MSLEISRALAALNGNKLYPKITQSTKYKHWVSVEDEKICKVCKDNHGKIWPISEMPDPKPPIHPKDRCEIKPMAAIIAGTATINGANGADWLIKYDDGLPSYYISEEAAMKNGWKQGKWPSNFVPNKMITMGVYKNKNNHLPHQSGRVWYEADINYVTGKRNTQRIVWSNDGLIFVTYDHYKTFYEII